MSTSLFLPQVRTRDWEEVPEPSFSSPSTVRENQDTFQRPQPLKRGFPFERDVTTSIDTPSASSVSPSAEYGHVSAYAYPFFAKPTLQRFQRRKPSRGAMTIVPLSDHDMPDSPVREYSHSTFSEPVLVNQPPSLKTAPQPLQPPPPTTTAKQEAGGGTSSTTSTTPSKEIASAATGTAIGEDNNTGKAAPSNSGKAATLEPAPPQPPLRMEKNPSNSNSANPIPTPPTKTLSSSRNSSKILDQAQDNSKDLQQPNFRPLLRTVVLIVAIVIVVSVMICLNRYPEVVLESMQYLTAFPSHLLPSIFGAAWNPNISSLTQFCPLRPYQGPEYFQSSVDLSRRVIEQYHTATITQELGSVPCSQWPSWYQFSSADPSYSLSTGLTSKTLTFRLCDQSNSPLQAHFPALFGLLNSPLLFSSHLLQVPLFGTPKVEGVTLFPKLCVTMVMRLSPRGRHGDDAKESAEEHGSAPLSPEGFTLEGMKSEAGEDGEPSFHRSQIEPGNIAILSGCNQWKISCPPVVTRVPHGSPAATATFLVLATKIGVENGLTQWLSQKVGTKALVRTMLQAAALSE